MGINEFLVESELTWNNIMVESMNIETRYLLKEDAEEIFNESINEVYQKIKEWVKKQIAYIKAFFAKLVAKCKQIMIKIQNANIYKPEHVSLTSVTINTKIECLNKAVTTINKAFQETYKIAISVNANTNKEQATKQMSILETYLTNIKSFYHETPIKEHVTLNFVKLAQDAGTKAKESPSLLVKTEKGLEQLLHNIDNSAKKNLDITVMKQVYTTLLKTNSVLIACINKSIADINTIIFSLKKKPSSAQ